MQGGMDLRRLFWMQHADAITSVISLPITQSCCSTSPVPSHRTATALCYVPVALQAVCPSGERMWVATTSSCVKGYDIPKDWPERRGHAGGHAGQVIRGGSMSRAFMGSSPAVRLRHSTEQHANQPQPLVQAPAAIIQGAPGERWGVKYRCSRGVHKSCGRTTPQ